MYDPATKKLTVVMASQENFRALDAMGDALHGILDVTIAYPHGRPTMVDLMAGRVPMVRVSIRQRLRPPAADPYS